MFTFIYTCIRTTHFLKKDECHALSFFNQSPLWDTWITETQTSQTQNMASNEFLFLDALSPQQLARHLNESLNASLRSTEQQVALFRESERNDAFYYMCRSSDVQDTVCFNFSWGYLAEQIKEELGVDLYKGLHEVMRITFKLLLEEALKTHPPEDKNLKNFLKMLVWHVLLPLDDPTLKEWAKRGRETRKMLQEIALYNEQQQQVNVLPDTTEELKTEPSMPLKAEEQTSPSAVITNRVYYQDGIHDPRYYFENWREEEPFLADLYCPSCQQDGSHLEFVGNLKICLSCLGKLTPVDQAAVRQHIYPCVEHDGVLACPHQVYQPNSGQEPRCGLHNSNATCSTSGCERQGQPLRSGICTACEKKHIDQRCQAYCYINGTLHYCHEFTRMGCGYFCVYHHRKWLQMSK